MSILETLNSPAPLKRMSVEELNTLAGELREKLLTVAINNGGHLSSNLGTVELTVALHSVFSSPYDRIIWDVGHQAYAHKLLTGRYKDFDTLRQYGGISGFPRRKESEHDSFGAGHASTSISAALGLALADKQAGKRNYTVAVAGDGAFTGGMIYEALNNTSVKGLRLIIVLNDNEMSISPSVGGINTYLGRLRTSPRYLGFKYKLKKFFAAIPLIGVPLTKMTRGIKNFFKRLVWRDNMFENLGLHYYGPVDGYDIKRMRTVLGDAMRDKNVSIVHVRTQKGRGYSPAEEQPEKYHGVPKGGKYKAGESFSSVFGDIMTRRGGEDKKLLAVTAAMCEGTGLKEFAARYPDRFCDVGIAEEHAMTFCGGLSAGDMHPVFAVYSTFAQRAYDQLIHDVALQGLPMILALDRAGIVGEDGPTHHGLFDVGFLLQIPSVEVYSPENYEDMRYSMAKGFEFNGITAVRYPRGAEQVYDRGGFVAADSGNMFYADYGKKPKVAIISYGRLCGNAVKAAQQLCKKGVSVRVVKILRLKPLNCDVFFELLKDSSLLYFAEEGMRSGGFAERALATMCEHGQTAGKTAVIRAVEDRFVPHGDTDRLFEDCGFLPNQMADEIWLKFGK